MIDIYAHGQIQDHCCWFCCKCCIRKMASSISEMLFVFVISVCGGDGGADCRASLETDFCSLFNSTPIRGPIIWGSIIRDQFSVVLKFGAQFSGVHLSVAQLSEDRLFGAQFAKSLPLAGLLSDQSS